MVLVAVVMGSCARTPPGSAGADRLQAAVQQREHILHGLRVEPIARVANSTGEFWFRFSADGGQGGTIDERFAAMYNVGIEGCSALYADRFASGFLSRTVAAHKHYHAVTDTDTLSRRHYFCCT